jgi:hypothetical protein
MVRSAAGKGWSGECGAQPAESGGDLGGPPPGAVNLQAGPADGAGELGGHVKGPVAEGSGLARASDGTCAKQISLAQ